MYGERLSLPNPLSAVLASTTHSELVKVAARNVVTLHSTVVDMSSCHAEEHLRVIERCVMSQLFAHNARRMYYAGNAKPEPGVAQE